LDLLKVLVSDFDQSLSGPGEVPHTGRVVHEPREHSKVILQSIPSLAHADHQMEISLHSIVEELVQLVIVHSGIFAQFFLVQVVFSHFFSDHREVLLRGEQVGDFAHSQDVIQVLHERFIDNLVVAE